MGGHRCLIVVGGRGVENISEAGQEGTEMIVLLLRMERRLELGRKERLGTFLSRGSHRAGKMVPSDPGGANSKVEYKSNAYREGREA